VNGAIRLLASDTEMLLSVVDVFKVMNWSPTRNDETVANRIPMSKNLAAGIIVCLFVCLNFKV